MYIYIYVYIYVYIYIYIYYIYYYIYIYIYIYIYNNSDPILLLRRIYLNEINADNDYYVHLILYSNTILNNIYIFTR